MTDRPDLQERLTRVVRQIEHWTLRHRTALTEARRQEATDRIADCVGLKHLLERLIHERTTRDA